MVPGAAADLDQVPTTALEGRVAMVVRAAEMRRGDQRSVESIGPGVVGADDGSPVPTRLVDQFRAAVPASIVKNPDSTVVVANDKEGLPRRCYRKEIAGSRHIVFEGNSNPRFAKHLLELIFQE